MAANRRNSGNWIDQLNKVFTIPEENPEYFDAIDNDAFSLKRWECYIRLYDSLSRRPMIFLQKSSLYMSHKQLPQGVDNRDEKSPVAILYETGGFGKAVKVGFKCIFCANLDAGCIESLTMHYHHYHHRFNFQLIDTRVPGKYNYKMTLNDDYSEANAGVIGTHNWYSSLIGTHNWYSRHVPVGRTQTNYVNVSHIKRVIDDTHNFKEFPECRVAGLEADNAVPGPSSASEPPHIAGSLSNSGGQGHQRCGCKKGCKTKNCSCKRAGMICNSRCHNSLSCSNK